MSGDLLMWVGFEGYPTIQSFIEEAERLGVSKRLSQIPPTLEPGRTKLFLAHDEGVRDHPVIFGYVTVAAVEVVGEPTVAIPEGLDVRHVTVEEANGEPARLSGTRLAGGAYLVCPPPRARTKPRMAWFASGEAIAMRKELGLLPDKRARFRSYRMVDGASLLASRHRTRYPSELVNREYDFRDLPASKRWSDAEREALLDLAERYGSYRGAKLFSLMSNRSLQAGMYQLREGV